jgi:hypothetical protein
MCGVRPVGLVSIHDEVHVAVKAELGSPKDVVLFAYEAASRGRFGQANALIAPAVRKQLDAAHAEVVAVTKHLRHTLLQLKGRRGKVATRDRQTLRTLIRSDRVLVGMQLQSPRFLNGLWKAFTQERGLAGVEVTRQVIRGSRARVYLRLTLRDGSVVKDSEPLVLHRGRWLLG